MAPLSCGAATNRTTFASSIGQKILNTNTHHIYTLTLRRRRVIRLLLLCMMLRLWLRILWLQ